jgi:hypothetical protein
MAFEITFEGSRINLHSPYSADDCAKRIEAAIDHDDTIASVPKEFDGTHDLIGRAGGGTVCLRKRMPSSYSFYGALFKPIFNGTLTPHGGGGTVIEGTCSMHRFGLGFVKLFGWGTTGFLVLMWVLIVVKMLIGNAHPGSAWGLLVIPLVIGAVYLYGRWMKRLAVADSAFMTQFLRVTLRADDQPGAG